MSRRRPALACLALCAGVALAAPAPAHEAERGPRDFGWQMLQAGLALRAAAPGPAALLDPTRLRPVHGRAAAPGFAGLRFFASGAGYAVGRRSAGYGLQGGAAFALDESVALTASYRLIGFALGDRLDPELADVEERSGAPFLGLDFAF